MRKQCDAFQHPLHPDICNKYTYTYTSYTCVCSVRPPKKSWKNISNLSGGEKTRLSLATLVVSQANVLLLDEPTNNLDPASREEILDALAHYKGSVVLVSHDDGAVVALNPERVLIMPDGVEDHWSTEYQELISLA